MTLKIRIKWVSVAYEMTHSSLSLRSRFGMLRRSENNSVNKLSEIFFEKNWMAHLICSMKTSVIIFCLTFCVVQMLFWKNGNIWNLYWIWCWKCISKTNFQMFQEEKSRRWFFQGWQSTLMQQKSNASTTWKEHWKALSLFLFDFVQKEPLLSFFFTTTTTKIHTFQCTSTWVLPPVNEGRTRDMREAILVITKRKRWKWKKKSAQTIRPLIIFFAF